MPSCRSARRHPAIIPNTPSTPARPPARPPSPVAEATGSLGPRRKLHGIGGGIRGKRETRPPRMSMGRLRAPTGAARAREDCCHMRRRRRARRRKGAHVQTNSANISFAMSEHLSSVRSPRIAQNKQHRRGIAHNFLIIGTASNKTMNELAVRPQVDQSCTRYLKECLAVHYLGALEGWWCMVFGVTTPKRRPPRSTC